MITETRIMLLFLQQWRVTLKHDFELFTNEYQLC